MSSYLEPGTVPYAIVIFVGVMVAVTAVNVLFLDAPIGSSAIRGVAIGIGAVVASFVAT